MEMGWREEGKEKCQVLEIGKMMERFQDERKISLVIE